MKVIKYTLHGNPVEMGWNEVNEEIAKREADDGDYGIEYVDTTEQTLDE